MSYESVSTERFADAFGTQTGASTIISRSFAL